MELPRRVPKKIVLGLLAIILIGVFILKLYFMFQTDHFQDSRSYYHLWQIENVGERGIPAYTDEFNANNKKLAVPPGYYLFSGLMYATFNSIIVLKIMEALLLVGILIIIFFLTKLATQNSKAGVFAVFLTATMPLVFSYPQNMLRPFYLSILVTLSFIYLFLKTNTTFENDESISNSLFIGRIAGLIILTFISALLGIHALFLLITVIIYISFKVVNQSQIRIYLREITIFITLVITGTYLLIYREAFREHGLQTLWNNMPVEYYREYANLFNIINSLGLINVVIVIGGIYGIYHFFKENEYSREKSHILFYGAGFFASFIMALISTGNPEFVFFIGGIMLAISFSIFLKKMISHAASNYKLKVSIDGYWLLSIITIIIVGSLFNISILETRSVSHVKYLEVSENTIEAFNWIKNETPEKSIIIGSPQHAALTRYFSERMFLIDEDFLFVRNPEKDLTNIKSIYTSIFRSDPERIINEYLLELGLENTAVFLLFDSHIAEEFKTTTPRFEENKECFEKKKEFGDIKIYQFLCNR